jgi:hypothetical protein
VRAAKRREARNRGLRRRRTLGAAADPDQGGDDRGQLRRRAPRVRELVELARTGAVPGIPITPRPLEEASAALEDLREGKLVGRAVLTP